MASSRYRATARDSPSRASSVGGSTTSGRFVDPLLGLLLPGIGDVVGSALGVYPIFLAWRRGASGGLLARMLLNLAVDALAGAVPVVGDVWDFFFRAHTRNLALLQARSTGDRRIHKRAVDGLIVAGAAVLLVAALALPLVLLGVLIKRLFGA